MATYVRQERNYVDLNEFQIEYLLESGGSAEMDVDGSSTSVPFEYTVPQGFYFLAERLCFVIIDQGGVNADTFGALAALDNGCLLEVERKNKIAKDLFAGLPIKSNGEWSALSGVDVSQLSGNRGVGIRWTLSKSTGFPLRLHPQDIIRLIVRDNLTALNLFRTTIQGVIISTSLIDDDRLK